MTEWYEEEGTLYSFLMEHTEVWYVWLTWTWNHTIDVDAPFRAVFSDGTKTDVVARFHGSIYDEEYTFIGSREDALKFATSYDCWDGLLDDEESGTIRNGILFVEHDGYDPDADEFPGKENELTEEYTYSGLYFYHPAGPYGHDGKMDPVYGYERSKIITLERYDENDRED